MLEITARNFLRKVQSASDQVIRRKYRFFYPPPIICSAYLLTGSTGTRESIDSGTSVALPNREIEYTLAFQRRGRRLPPLTLSMNGHFESLTAR